MKDALVWLKENTGHVAERKYFWCAHYQVLYFPVYKTILLSKILRLKIEVHRIHGSKLRREQKQVKGESRDQSNPTGL